MQLDTTQACSNPLALMTKETGSGPIVIPGETQIATETMTATMPVSGSLPQRTTSYVVAVTGGTQLPKPPISEWIPVGEHDLIQGSIQGESELKISDKFRSRLSAPWQRTLVVRLLVRTIGYSILCNRIRAFCRPTSALEVFALDDDCFLVKLGNDEDFFKALTEGPWVIFYHYLLVYQWTSGFRVLDSLPNSMVVLIQFPGLPLPVHFYHKELLFTQGP
ncbi:unnamed protein product [Linum trigynum]|uniref:DUF4283 domain-containing protein n=1 Tax=Linum trigynum TaxID=586398 RepID=A0AAV2EPF9_9ROSI